MKYNMHKLKERTHMKLNLGCGGDHKRGHLNVDAFDDTIADKIMPATNLQFDDNTVEEILMSQVIEHFGIARSIYALSECFRVLQPGGKLILEMPDIQESFKIYLNGEREDRKYILPWIYGVDMPGMQHRFCFPGDLLREELEKIGFTDIEKSFLKFDKHQPILRVVCKKPNDFQVFQLISKYRKKLLNDNKIDLDNQINALEKEILIECFTNGLKKVYRHRDNKIFEDLIVNGAVLSSPLSCEFVKIVIKENIVSKEHGESYIEALRDLDDIGFPGILLDKLTQVDGFVGRQDELFDSIYNYGKEMVKQFLSFTENDRDKLKKDLLKGKKSDINYEIDFFSTKLIMLRANQFFQKGVKAFNLLEYKEAIEHFDEAANLYRDQILTYWNLGRLYELEGNEKRSKSHYQNALHLLTVIEYEKNKQLKKILEQEMTSIHAQDCEDPLISLRQIYELADK